MQAGFWIGDLACLDELRARLKSLDALDTRFSMQKIPAIALHGLIELSSNLHENRRVFVIPLRHFDFADEEWLQRQVLDHYLILGQYQFKELSRSMKVSAEATPKARIQAVLARHFPSIMDASIFAQFLTKWELYDDFLLAHEDSWSSDAWEEILDQTKEDVLKQLFMDVCEIFHVQSLARKARIQPGALRQPKLTWYVREGAFIQQPAARSLDFEHVFWTGTSQNGVRYTWCPDKTMFSRGNISEKLRIAQDRTGVFSDGEVVVDMYVGIGYFTLPYLIHRHAKRVYACEWNEWSVEGLKRSLDYHGVSYARVDVGPDTQPPHVDETKRVLIFQGDNQYAPAYFQGKADRVNLGLLPSSEPSWKLAVEALKPSGGWVHVHMNVDEDQLPDFQERVVREFQDLLQQYKPYSIYRVELRHLERVKSFGPRVWHYVADLLIAKVSD